MPASAYRDGRRSSWLQKEWYANLPLIAMEGIMRHPLKVGVGLALLVCTIVVHRPAAPRKSVTEAIGAHSSRFFMIQLADPQFGLQHRDQRWHGEQAMLNRSIQLINRLSPRFIVMTGDLQNWYPTTAGMRPDGSGEPGAAQVAALKQSLSLLDASIPLRANIPGNHDLGDAPTLKTLDTFQENWSADRYSFDEGGVAFLALNSQLYYNASQSGVGRRAERQTAWLSRQLDAAASRGAIAVVVLSHIPPFVVAADEPSGWANWPTPVRQQVLQMTQQKQLPPSLFVNGHFHANVEGVRSAAFGAAVESVTTSSVGCPIHWNGSAASPLPHASAMAVATQPSGQSAFENYILHNGRPGEPADVSRIAQRVQARPDRSGVRLFEFDAGMGFRHRWFTLEELSELNTPLATYGESSSSSPLAGMAFSPWARAHPATKPDRELLLVSR